VGPAQVIGSTKLIRIGLVKVSRVGIFELLWPDARVNLCAGQVLVSKQLLNNPNIRTIFQQVTRK
jgi:hypothetical protein